MRQNPTKIGVVNLIRTRKPTFPSRGGSLHQEDLGSGRMTSTIELGPHKTGSTIRHHLHIPERHHHHHHH